MSFSVGNAPVTASNLGNRRVDRAYRGGVQVYGYGPDPPPVPPAVLVFGESHNPSDNGVQTIAQRCDTFTPIGMTACRCGGQVVLTIGNAPALAKLVAAYKVLNGSHPVYGGRSVKGVINTGGTNSELSAYTLAEIEAGGVLVGQAITADAASFSTLIGFKIFNEIDLNVFNEFQFGGQAAAEARALLWAERVEAWYTGLIAGLGVGSPFLALPRLAPSLSNIDGVWGKACLTAFASLNLYPSIITGVNGHFYYARSSFTITPGTPPTAVISALAPVTRVNTALFESGFSVSLAAAALVPRATGEFNIQRTTFNGANAERNAKASMLALCQSLDGDAAMLWALAYSCFAYDPSDPLIKANYLITAENAAGEALYQHIYA